MFGYTTLFSRTRSTTGTNILGVLNTVLLNGLRRAPDWEKIIHTKVSITTVRTTLYRKVPCFLESNTELRKIQYKIQPLSEFIGYQNVMVF